MRTEWNPTRKKIEGHWIYENKNNGGQGAEMLFHSIRILFILNPQRTSRYAEKGDA